eukprot:387222-Rhodomonas_salina.1
MAGMELRDESKKLEEDRRQREAEEEAARMDVVRQIRAMESVPVDRNAHFDPTSVSEKSNHVLEAMSMAELLQRLQMVKTVRALCLFVLFVGERVGSRWKAWGFVRRVMEEEEDGGGGAG